MDTDQFTTSSNKLRTTLVVSIIINIIAILIIIPMMIHANSANQHNNNEMNTSNSHSDEHNSIHDAHEDFVIPLTAENIPTIELQAIADAKGGYNINIKTTNFDFSPEQVNTETDSFNEGHAHLYINNIKTMRLYSNWFHIAPSSLTKDLNTIHVELNTNTHKVLHIGDVTLSKQIELIRDPNAIDRFEVKLNEWRYIQSARPEVILIDVRTEAEFKEGYLPNAINIPVERSDFADRIAQLDKNQEYLLYCRTGNRSKIAFGIMEQAGFTKILNAEEGFPSWKAAGYPTNQ